MESLPMNNSFPLLILLLALLSSSLSFGSELRHQIAVTDSPLSLQTQGLCHSFYRIKDQLLCLPWAGGITSGLRLSLSTLFKYDKEAMYIVQRLNKKDVDQAFIDDLFRNNNFHDASGYATVQAQYKNIV